jgi:hypothetical protein
LAHDHYYVFIYNYIMGKFADSLPNATYACEILLNQAVPLCGQALKNIYKSLESTAFFGFVHKAAGHNN